MIDLATYRARIGLFRQKLGTTNVYSDIRQDSRSGSLNVNMILKLTLIVLVLSSTLNSGSGNIYQDCNNDGGFTVGRGNSFNWVKHLQWVNLHRLGANQTSNFKARYLNGNIKRGLINIHVNVRSLYRKMSEIKRLIQQEKPHILGISECELKKNHHQLDKLKIPGFDLLLPKSWQVHGNARVVVFIKKTLHYTHIEDIENEDVQTIWLRAGFKNSKKVYYSHQYREHTNTLGNSMAAQRTSLEKMLEQWENAIIHGNPDTPNEVIIAGDMNLNSLGGRWLEPDYTLVSLARMVVDTCNANNFSQLVDRITRSQFNSIRNETDVSCIDHIYSNAKHRVSPVKIVSFGASDHDAIICTRYSKEPSPPARTIRKRSYKKFNKDKYIDDISKLDFSDVYFSRDVDEAADILTEKIVVFSISMLPGLCFNRENTLHLGSQQRLSN